MGQEASMGLNSIPLSERRGPVTMGLLWITMVTFFPGVLVGFQWFKEGLGLQQVLVCTILACILILIYTIPAAHLAALTGRGYGQLNKQVFGKIGAALINFNLIWMSVVWYGLTALFLAEGLCGLFHFKVSVAMLSGILAVLMALNNFFGFKGIANFARYLAAPILVAWVFYTFTKVVPNCSITVLQEVPSHSFTFAMTTVASFVIGVAVWGNEADYWRYGKAKVANSAAPLIVALLIGQIVFPATGWLVAHMTGITDYAAATEFMSKYSFAGIPVIGALVLCASYFATNDSGLYASSTALENLFSFKHRTAVTILAMLGASVACGLSFCGGAKALESVASISSIVLPTPTVIVLTEWLLSSKVFFRTKDFLQGRDCLAEGKIFDVALITLVIALTFGVVTSGVIPGTAHLHVGICPLQTWILAVAIYVPLRVYRYRREQAARFQKATTAKSTEMELEAVH